MELSGSRNRQTAFRDNIPVHFACNRQIACANVGAGDAALANDNIQDALDIPPEFSLNTKTCFAHHLPFGMRSLADQRIGRAKMLRRFEHSDLPKVMDNCTILRRRPVVVLSRPDIASG
ncbi:hypothetical protein D3C84_1022940 [compost metagenome]